MKFNDTFVKFLNKWFEDKQTMKKADYERIKGYASEVLK